MKLTWQIHAVVNTCTMNCSDIDSLVSVIHKCYTKRIQQKLSVCFLHFCEYLMDIIFLSWHIHSQLLPLQATTKTNVARHECAGHPCCSWPLLYRLYRDVYQKLLGRLSRLKNQWNPFGRRYALVLRPWQETSERTQSIFEDITLRPLNLIQFSPFSQFYWYQAQLDLSCLLQGLCHPVLNHVSESKTLGHVLVSSRICWSPDILHVLPVLFHSSAWVWYAFFTTDLGAATAHISDKKPLRTAWLTSSTGMSYGLMSMSSAKTGCFGRLKQIQQYRRTLSSFAHSSLMGVPSATFPCRSRLSSWLTRSLCWFCKLPLCLSVLRMILLLQLGVLCIFSCLSVPMPSPVCVSLCRWS